MSLDNYDITADPDNIFEDIKDTVYPFDTARFTSESFASIFELLETKRDIEQTQFREGMFRMQVDALGREDEMLQAICDR